ncbi:alkaline phosphatase [Tahibacter harae]|uniref:Alkaline phosphatase n=1 Tax=Tahibacter harae TaxID=2963937 RepID=A0ABT1QVK4_9GAMM|nr:alkaline phosphatase [Tahibacter harae]MCQ4166321.1 alkaline phosphatase [Tahibacter harae]
MRILMLSRLALGTALALGLFAAPVQAATVSRLTPPSELFASGTSDPVISRFLPGQRFDLQATVQPDAGETIESFRFLVDGKVVNGPTPIGGGGASDPRLLRNGLVRETGPAACIANGKTTGAAGCSLVAGLAAGSAVVSFRGYSNYEPGVHEFKVNARTSTGRTLSATGNFEVVGIAEGGKPAKNIIILLGDGMGASHRTAARIMAKGYAQGKARGKLAMDTFPYTGQVMTASLNSIVTDSAPGMANYVSGNKANNNEEGVWPDDTLAAFDNPRIEYLSQYLHMLQGKSLGIVTTSDVFDATPAANAVHTALRGNGTGIVDQFLDESDKTGLTVLLGGGRKWFLPNPSNSTSPQPANGSQRRASTDYVLPADIIAGWGVAPGKLDPERDLIADFVGAGFAYAPDNTALNTAFSRGVPDKLLGLFAYSNMNVSYDKIAARRGNREVVDAFGFPDQPMLDEMTDKALQVLSRNRNGFVAMIEGASIDKQAHLMDTDRWIHDVMEFDRAVAVARQFAERNPDTLVIVTADHECSGAAIIGAATVTAAQLEADRLQGKNVVGIYEAARFPRYTLAADGYPVTTHIDHKMLIGYGANADRYENWLPSAFPTRDSQQPFPPAQSPANPSVRNKDNGVLITGQIAGDQAAHTGTDIPLSAFGRGSSHFTGTFDNTDVFFKLGQIAVGGE